MSESLGQAKGKGHAPTGKGAHGGHHALNHEHSSHSFADNPHVNNNSGTFQGSGTFGLSDGGTV